MLFSATTLSPPDPQLLSQPPSPSVASSMQGKRAAMVVYSSYPADPRPRRAVDELLNQGMSLDLICLGDEHEPKKETIGRLNIIRVSITHHRGGILLYAYQYLAFILASAAILAARSLKPGYDLVYVHNMPDILVLSALIPKAFGAMVILDLHDPMPELMMTIFNRQKDSFRVKLIRRLEKWSIKRANLVITVNIACKRIFSSRSCPDGKIGVVMNSPDEKIFQFRPPQSNRGAKETGRPFVIMYHGSIIERNGLDLAVDAFARVREAIPSAELRIYGRNTPFLERVMKDVHDRGLDDSIRYLGAKRLEELVPEIENCDLGIIPNHHNAFTEINTPTRIFEYLALGKPVIAPSAPGIQDYFSPESLVFFESGNSEDLAKQIEHVFNRHENVLETVRRGQQIYEMHSWNHERQILASLVCNLLKQESQRKLAAK